MTEMVRMTLRVTPEQKAELEAAVQRGEYPNESEAVRAALREKYQEEHRPVELIPPEGNGHAEAYR